MKLLLTHTPAMRANYYGDRPLVALRAFADVRLHEHKTALDAGGLIAAADGCDIILSDRMTPGPAAIFEVLPRLKVFMRCAVDIRTIDVGAASAAGVLVTRAKPGFVESVAELAVGYLVDLARGVSRATASYQRGAVTVASMGRQLAGSTIGIIGYGVIGQRLADLADALGMPVLISDPHVTVWERNRRQVDLATLLAEADHVVCLAVATEATENLMNAAAFARMKRDAVFLNLSRGNLVDEAALAAALREGRIAGAALDVGRAPDQLPTPELARLPNVIATPHIGGLTPEAVEAQAMDTVAQVRALVAGKIPHGAVNKSAWRRR
jgi:D-3-phosphoglycerate dehydrogenase / 2-oxoglutarate reductase